MIVNTAKGRGLLTATHVTKMFREGEKVTVAQYAMRKQRNVVTEVQNGFNFLMKHSLVQSYGQDLCFIPINEPSMCGVKSDILWSFADTQDANKGSCVFFTNGSRVNTTFIRSSTNRHQLLMSTFGQPGDSGSPVCLVKPDGAIGGVIGIYQGVMDKTTPQVGVVEMFKPMASAYSKLSKN